MQAIAIQDANIIIDLVKIELFDTCLGLPYQFFTTDLILYSELNEDQIAFIETHIQAKRFTLIKISPDELFEIKIESKRDTRLSEQDWSAYYYAKKMNALLMSDDDRVCKLAKAEGMTVCGTPWILDKLLEKNIIERLQALEYLKDLMLKNKRLPMDECEKRLKLWLKMRE
jgi:predicted nucleic acid-binding protein